MVIVLVLLMLVAGLGGAGSPAQAAPPDATSPAGTVTGAIVVFSPGSILLLVPTPATGSLVVPLRGPSLTQLQLVIPGPNPAQNTTIGLAQLLSTLLGSTLAAANQGGPLVSVFATSSR